jgi:hypothetical protein
VAALGQLPQQVLADETGGAGESEQQWEPSLFGDAPATKLSARWHAIRVGRGQSYQPQAVHRPRLGHRGFDRERDYTPTGAKG